MSTSPFVRSSLAGRSAHFGHSGRVVVAVFVVMVVVGYQPSFLNSNRPPVVTPVGIPWGSTIKSIRPRFFHFGI
jgi:hypothetical protein